MLKMKKSYSKQSDLPTIPEKVVLNDDTKKEAEIPAYWKLSVPYYFERKTGEI